MGPIESLEAANAIAGTPAYRIDVVSPSRGRVRLSNGLTLSAGPLPAPPPRHDTLLVAGGVGTRPAVEDAGVVDAVGAASRRARRTASVCTGAYLLAAAGLLDGRRATTHWRYCEALARRHPQISIDPDAIYVRDGDLW